MTESHKAELAELRNRAAELKDLERVMGLLGWDQETMMPSRGVRWRASQAATIQGLYHERLTAPRIGELLKQLEEPATNPGSDFTEFERALVRELKREHDRAVKIPTDIVVALARATTEGVEAWRQARASSQWSGFADHLERIADLERQIAEHVGYDGSPYNALLDDYEPGMTVEMLEPLFAQLRTDTIDLIRRLQASPSQPSRELIQQRYPIDQQRQLATTAIELLGFDFTAGRVDVSTHPFAQAMGPTDVRITTRFKEDDLAYSFFSALHECGHALYEQNVDVELADTLIGRGASLGVHESQSRLWENFVGRSLPFWTFFLPRAVDLFPEQLKGCQPIDVVRAVNVVRPSLIRTEADEVTYNLHIILRFEIEAALISNRIAVADLPEVWNTKMEEMLGIEPPADREGVLQDTHWASGLIGYFPTYTLGNLIAAQIWHKVGQVFPDRDERIANGDLAFLRAWLTENIYRFGKLYRPANLIERVTGEPLNAKYLTQYLNEKYSRIYDLPAQ